MTDEAREIAAFYALILPFGIIMWMAVGLFAFYVVRDGIKAILERKKKHE